jgi:hypothetical protein
MCTALASAMRIEGFLAFIFYLRILKQKFFTVWCSIELKQLNLIVGSCFHLFVMVLLLLEIIVIFLLHMISDFKTLLVTDREQCKKHCTK